MNALMKLFGMVVMNESGADGGDGGSTAGAADADAGAITTENTTILGDAATDAGAEGGEKKPEGEGGDDSSKEEKKPASEAPEKYEAFKVAEGMELDATAMTAIETLFREELGLSQEKAQVVLDKLLEIQQGLYGTEEEQAAAQHEQLVNTTKTWADETRNLPNIGGENFDASLKVASRVMQQFGTKEFQQVMNRSGLGSHPEFFKFVHAIGLKMSPDAFEHGGETPKGERRAADILFGDLFNKA